jgi:hypothetical protein
MNQSMLLALGLVVGVAALALWLRRQSVSTPESMPVPAPAGEHLSDPDEDDFEIDEEGAGAITVDGLAFIPDEHGVNLVPTPDPLEPAPGKVIPVEYLRPGDFTGARVVRGNLSRDPWRLELLGREGEYVTYGFEVEEAARIALDLLEQRSVMRLVRDDEGRPFKPSNEQFEEARRRHDETERLLAHGEEGDGSQPLH